jgi:PAS domain S-box-containing protein
MPSGTLAHCNAHPECKTFVAASPDSLMGNLMMEPEKQQNQMLEEALRESAEPDRELFENSKDAMYVHNLSGIYTSVNRAAEELSGYSRDEIIGQPFWKFVAPEYVKQARAYLCQKLEEVGETKYELEIIKKGGRRVPVEVTSRIIRDKGVPVGVQGAARDISERRRVQQALSRYSRLIRVRQVGRQNIGREKHDTATWDGSLQPKKE